ncbi:glycoside hydrolase family 5 protein [Dothistroma septosporum NZE10]|uniref:glucan 1,3-beta-glucosidase n=1 Tax=Dothistroma septosporum (strain NZE10 / CBS 128990) TaxID=675120 RepID=N1PNN8_DOTSN|nr:glycoside hydrolase family 5 protein [Dothistroma septosporum NZE10]
MSCVIHLLLVVLLGSATVNAQNQRPPPRPTTAATPSKPSTSSSSSKTTSTSSQSVATTSIAKLATSATSQSSSGSSFSSAWSSITSQSSTGSSIIPAQTPSTTSVPSGYIRGVNIGAWLLLEPWMNTDLFSGTTAIDELTFDALPSASSALSNHWATYFTEADVEFIAGYGMNALRIPIGFWAFDTLGTPFISGAQAYLDQAIVWARASGLKVLVDIHGSPGSQNGWDHSGNATGCSWQLGSNTTYLGDSMLNNINVLKQVVTKYGSTQYADVVYAIEIANEPISWGANNIDVTKNWASVAYSAMKSVATNPDVQILMHDGFMGPQDWYDLASAINSNSASPQFALDVHLYQNQVASDSSLNMTQHIQNACNWGNTAKNSLLPVYVGEFSAAVNICVNPDGSNFGDDGTQSCTVTGCQCTSTVSIDQWSPALKNLTRMYWEAQIQAFEHANAGYFLWGFGAWGGWSMRDLYSYGVIGDTINERVYGTQCTFVV